MVPGSLPLAIAPPTFPRGRLVFSVCRAEACGFVMAYIFQERGTVAPGKCRRCSVQDWPPSRRRSAPTPPQMGPCGCAAIPARVFSAPARGTRSRVPLLEREHSSLQEDFPLYTVLPTRRGEGRKGGMRQKESNRQRGGKRPVATARVIGTDRWGRAPAPPRSVLVVSGQTILLIAGGVAAGSSPDRRRSALFSRHAVWRAISWKAGSS
jgi:hypothetical protein